MNKNQILLQKLSLKTASWEKALMTKLSSILVIQKSCFRLHQGLTINGLEDFYINHDFVVKSNTLAVKVISPNGEV